MAATFGEHSHPVCSSDLAIDLNGFGPVADARIRCLILGSFPGDASLKAARYYAHPRNQFWPLMSLLLEQDLMAMSYVDRLQSLLDHRIGLWDVYASCQRKGSLDSAIQVPKLNDFSELIKTCPDLRAALHNGAESAKTAKKFQSLGLQTFTLPSTSPAHASKTLQQKYVLWKAVFDQISD